MRVNRYIRFQGPLQIKIFTDNVYASITDKDGKISISMIAIQFDILSSSKIGSNEEKEEGEESKEIKNGENSEEKVSEEIIPTQSKQQLFNHNKRLFNLNLFHLNPNHHLSKQRLIQFNHNRHLFNLQLLLFNLRQILHNIRLWRNQKEI